LVKNPLQQVEILAFFPLIPVMGLLNDFLNFVYPRQCEVCGRLLAEGEVVMCTDCIFFMPRTGFHRDPENRLASMFWGRVRIERAAAFFYYTKGSDYTRLLHRLKYGGRKEIGTELGRMYASELKDSEYAVADILIPVPLHRSRQRQRGYNQSALIAGGLSDVLGIPSQTGNLVRDSRTSTQTRRGRFERFLNMEGRFRVVNAQAIAGKHILLVDDVITTGATIEACAQALLDAGCGEISVVSLGAA
jgi:ComF family protein